MVGILQMNGFGEESTLMQDLKPFRILISLLDKPELGNVCMCNVCNVLGHNYVVVDFYFIV